MQSKFALVHVLPYPFSFTPHRTGNLMAALSLPPFMPSQLVSALAPPSDQRPKVGHGELGLPNLTPKTEGGSEMGRGREWKEGKEGATTNK